jgi:hypothetical protein
MEQSEGRGSSRSPDLKQRVAELRGVSGIRSEAVPLERLGTMSPSPSPGRTQSEPASRERFIQKQGTQIGRPAAGYGRGDPAGLAAHYRGTNGPAKTADRSRESLGELRPAATPARTQAREQAPPVREGRER